MAMSRNPRVLEYALDYATELGWLMIFMHMVGGDRRPGVDLVVTTQRLICALSAICG